MYWFENYYKLNMSYDLLVRAPFSFSSRKWRSIVSNVSGDLEISLSKVKNKEDQTLFLSSLLMILSFGNKSRLTKIKGFSGKKTYILNLKFNDRKVFSFIDIFLTLMIKGMKRRFIILKTSLSSTGSLNLRFNSFSELEMDDYFFFEIDQWQSFFNIFFNFSRSSLTSFFVSKFLINIFNFNKLLRYEILSTKG